MRVVFATAEVSPIAKTGGLGDVCGSLPKELAKLGHEIVVFMPFYRQARLWFESRGIAVHQALPTVTLDWANWTAEATYLRTTLPGTNIPLILVANDHFFERDHIYEKDVDGVDDFLLRYTFFSRAVIRGCELLDIAPDILHCHDWHTALLPAYLVSGLRNETHFRRTRSVYTIHNLAYQGDAAAEAFALTGLHSRFWRYDAAEHWGRLNPMKAGIQLADELTTVSPTYAREIQTVEHGAGLDPALRAMSPKLTGILNGIDVEEWNPATDALLPHAFDANDLRGKRANRQALLDEAGMSGSPELPVIVAISRLVEQKGFQLLVPVLPRLLEAGARVLILGSGDSGLEDALSRIARAHPDRCRVWIGFDNALAHRLYGGGDMLLMPSIYEPCGLNQMYASRYGTIPIVRLTGGLVDTVTPFDGTNLEQATGFGFEAADSTDLYNAAWAALLNYRDQQTWQALVRNGMARDFSWERSARAYDAVYRRAAG